MRELGNYTEDAVIDFTFNTTKADGTPITLAGSPTLAVYKGNGTTQSTAGLTLTVGFDSVVGLHHVRLDSSADAFYATGEDYSIVLEAGTVDSVSVVGTTLARFSIQKQYMRGTEGAYTGGNITGNLSGSVGSVTGAVGSVTAEVDANVTKVAGAAVAGVNDFKASVAGLATEANVDAVGVAVLARAVPGDAMALTALAITAIDTELSATHGAGSWESAGVAAGANIVVITVNDALGFPVPSTSVVVRNNSDNATIGFYVTNNNGQITANLDNSPAGLPYKVRLGKVGLMFTIPENLTVLGDTNQTYTGTVVDPGVPVAGLQTLSGNIKLLTGDAEPNATVRAVIASMPQHVDVSVLSNVVSEAETDSNGNFSLYLIKGASVTLYISQDVNGRRFWQKTITVTDDNTRNIVEY